VFLAPTQRFGDFQLRHLKEILEIEPGTKIEKHAQVNPVEFGIHRQRPVNLADFASEPYLLENRLLVSQIDSSPIVLSALPHRSQTRKHGAGAVCALLARGFWQGRNRYTISGT